MKESIGKIYVLIIVEFSPLLTLIIILPTTLSFLITDHACSVGIQQKARHLAEMYKKIIPNSFATTFNPWLNIEF